MFVFIMLMASPEWKPEKWSDTSAIANISLRSVLNQNNQQFRVILVCNEPPEKLISHSNLTVAKVNFPCPRNYDEILEDIRKKIKFGMTVAKAFAPCFVMRIDSDDFVSNKLVDFARQNANSNGWYIKWGYRFNFANSELHLQPKFHMNCGTAHIINCRPEDFPTTMDTPKGRWLDFIWEHQNINHYLAPRGRKVRPLPFLGVIRGVNTGKNILAKPAGYKNTAKRLIYNTFLKRRLTPRIIEEFHLPVAHHQLAIG